MTIARLDPDERRLLLIDATLEALPRYGAAHISVRMIAAQAGVSPALITHYFGGIDHLIGHAYCRHADRLGTALEAALSQAGPSPRDRLAAYVMAHFQPPVVDDRFLATWLALIGLSRTNGDVASVHKAHRQTARLRVEELMADCVPGRDHRLPALALESLLEGFWMAISCDREAVCLQDAEALALIWLRFLGQPRADGSPASGFAPSPRVGGATRNITH